MPAVAVSRVVLLWHHDLVWHSTCGSSNSSSVYLGLLHGVHPAPALVAMAGRDVDHLPLPCNTRIVGCLLPVEVPIQVATRGPGPANPEVRLFCLVA